MEEQLSRELELGTAPEGMLTPVVDKDDGILIAPQSLLREIRRDQRQFLPYPLFGSVLGDIFAFGSEADAERGTGQRGDPGKNVRVLLQLERQRLAVAL